MQIQSRAVLPHKIQYMQYRGQKAVRGMKILDRLLIWK